MVNYQLKFLMNSPRRTDKTASKLKTNGFMRNDTIFGVELRK